MTKLIQYLRSFSVVDLVCFGSVFLSSQRFLLSPIDSLSCVLIFGVALFYFNRNNAKFLALLIMAIFVSVDNGGAIFSETPGAIRYVFYLTAVFFAVYKMRISAKGIMLLGIFSFLPIVIMLFHRDILVMSLLFKRDLFLIFLGIIVLATHHNSLNRFELDFAFLTQMFLVYMVGELINIAFFFSVFEHGYLSFDSNKSLIIFPFLYVLHSKLSNFLKFLFFLLTFVICVFYVTRMVILSLFLVLLIYFFKRIRTIKIRYWVILGVAIFSLSHVKIGPSLDLIKFVHTLNKAVGKVSLVESIRALDPVRFGEIEIFIDQHYFNIIFGNGLGTGLYDKKGYFGFVDFYQTAFTENELSSGFFYNFHDVWIDIGLRFGLFPLFLVLAILFKDVRPERGKISQLAMMLIILIFCQFWTMSGLILMSLFALFYRYHKNLLAISEQ